MNVVRVIVFVVCCVLGGVLAAYAGIGFVVEKTYYLATIGIIFCFLSLWLGCLMTSDNFKDKLKETLKVFTFSITISTILAILTRMVLN